MREILFRGKKDNGEWVEGYLYRLSETLNPFIMIPNQLGEAYEVDPEAVFQYTGLIDKNGKKNFEGDILNVIYSDSVGECHHVEGCVVDDLRKTEVIGWLDYANELEVIGNIFDNKDLLTD